MVEGTVRPVGQPPVAVIPVESVGPGAGTRARTVGLPIAVGLPVGPGTVGSICWTTRRVCWSSRTRRINQYDDIRVLPTKKDIYASLLKEAISLDHHHMMIKVTIQSYPPVPHHT